ncbi:UDP-N-acetylmuramate--L-alanyl-gamma-D-glutamyl-meso-2,6-diaminoheptandioate ligase [Thiohalobacter sp. COW1]|uniref:UDP-N-acetylmuramate--L-alanyl-gamma-D-glutamyl-meso-2,6-diaminoheptandioate ligase n=1 Tax=Thiohalobacter thiocyanaticus TaxID=585455 RepID=A0A1Z4VPK9_9GAMM|nr:MULTISPECIES: UDP-N-acetylmuramate:L-alanyl-gamma-D-glutamyl-meso-diaminopimelate ligase [Thiohalobacter]BAZ93164.1 UDP-N-acetylmuramate:L-alanyl-gamma-D-glutamyl-meso-diaminopimelate ligase [Thiohalobacter thiocyanaticus]BCO31824.1 UDP-N-acetylmuramate--L-alanyl-gamma-D-glutamyl-meso-2,6-diaminoheptandioate ligase [Thiohalobacter sp. COW1]
MHIHILGICGTFMGGIAVLARESGIEVTGADAGVYPPMSTQLEALGIGLQEGYRAEDLPSAPDAVVIGNALSRGNPAVEAVLDAGMPYTSGPQWLADNILRQRWVLAVAGTHGKTSTASMLAWILEHAGLNPGFLIGGVPANFGISARLGDSPFFVVEADEYDTAFFDKRSKFIHYRPRTLILNNLEFDHADIFEDLTAIQRQFHHLVRTVPGQGLIVENADDAHVAEVLEMGCWTPTETVSVGEFPGQWQARRLRADASEFEVLFEGRAQGTVRWGQVGEHNLHNALAAIAAARHAGVPAAHAIEALGEYRGVKRRLEVRGEVRGVTVYDDFAHHPTAIALTLQGLRRHRSEGRILAVLEPRSNTMRLGVHHATLGPALNEADRVWLYQPPELDWDLDEVGGRSRAPVRVMRELEALVMDVVAHARPGDAILVMSNGGFGGIHDKLLDALRMSEAIEAGG